MISISDSPFQSTTTPAYNLNFKTIFLFVILISACCLLSIGFNFEINNIFNSRTSMSACCILVLFIFYVLYEFFKKDTCEDLSKSGWDRLKSSASRGTNYLGQSGTNGIMALGNSIIPSSPGLSMNSSMTPYMNSSISSPITPPTNTMGTQLYNPPTNTMGTQPYNPL
jgi:hypothetical protein